MSSFFKTPQYKALCKVREYVMNINTEGNYNKFMDVYNDCAKLAQDKYKNIGWREDTKTYAWGNTHDIPQRMVCLVGLSFLDTHKMYISEDQKTWIMKDKKNGELTTYSEIETNALKQYGAKDLASIHKIKNEFEGEISNGNETRKCASLKNKKGVK